MQVAGTVFKIAYRYDKLAVPPSENGKPMVFGELENRVSYFV